MIKFQNLKIFWQIIHLFAILCAPVSKKEVVDSRVESRVCYSFDFSQINVIFVCVGGGVFTNMYKLCKNNKKIKFYQIWDFNCDFVIWSLNILL